MALPGPMMMLCVAMFCLKVSLAQSGGDIVSYESQPQKELQCDVTGTERCVAWVDSTERGVPLFTYFKGDAQPLNQIESDDTEHSNFNYTFLQRSHFNLLINDVMRTDGGSYDCIRTVSVGEEETLHYTLRVEVPGTISIKDENAAEITCSPLDVIVGVPYPITCQIIEARSSNNLVITWNPSSGDVTGSNPTSDGVTLMDYTSTIAYQPAKDHTSITCSLGQFESQLGEVTDSVTLNVRYRPECTLTYSFPGDDCSQVELTCDCDANPEPEIYEFHRDGVVIGTTSGNTVTVNVEMDIHVAFTCRARNSIDEVRRFGVTTQLEDIDTCPSGSLIGIIIGIIGAVVVVICLVAFLLWFFKYRGGGDEHEAAHPRL